jgi:S-adenosylmethionine decarboxylase
MNTSLHLGEHIIFDLSGCDQEILFDSDRSYALFASAVRASGLTVIDEGFFKFSPHGFTCFLLLSESHASVHAWPEHGYLAIDLFTCNLGKDLTPLLEQLKSDFRAQSYNLHELNRYAQVPENIPMLADGSIA